MNNLDRIKSLRAQDVSTTDVDWLIAEAERLTVELRASEAESLKHALAVGRVCIELSGEKREVERLQIVADFERESAKDANAQLNAMRADRDRYKAWHDCVAIQLTAAMADGGDSRITLYGAGLRKAELIVRPQPLKENE